MLRKTLASILILVFFSLQYGKVASYWYCKWQADQQQLKDCGCESHLEELVADSDLHDGPQHFSKSLFSDYILVSPVLIELPEHTFQSFLGDSRPQVIPDPPIEAALRPPIA